MTPNIDKFIASVQKELDANGGKIPAPRYFAIGKLCGMKCKETADAKKAHFGSRSGKKAKVAKSPKKPAKKTIVKKATKGSDDCLTAAELKALGKVDESTGLVQDDESGYVWIASPEEIASTKDLHETDY